MNNTVNSIYIKASKSMRCLQKKLYLGLVGIHARRKKSTQFFLIIIGVPVSGITEMMKVHFQTQPHKFHHPLPLSKDTVPQAGLVTFSFHQVMCCFVTVDSISTFFADIRTTHKKWFFLSRNCSIWSANINRNHQNICSCAVEISVTSLQVNYMVLIEHE